MAKKLIYKVEVDTSKASSDLNDLGNQLDDIKEKSKVDIAIENANAVKSVGDLRKAYKELINIQTEYGEGTEEFQKAAQAAGGLRDRLDAVKESVNSFSASPIENVANSFSDLKSKIFALDLEGAKQSFSNLSTNVVDLGKSILGIGASSSAAAIGVRVLAAALAATGITLIVGAVALLVTQFSNLSQAGGLVGATFEKVGKVVTFLKDAVVNLADSWGLVDKNATDAAIAQQKAAEETNKKLRDLNTSLIEDEELRKKQQILNEARDRAAQEENAEIRKLIFKKAEQDILDVAAEFRKKEQEALNKSVEDAKKAEADKLQAKINAIRAENDLDEEVEVNLAAKELAKIEAEKKASADQLARVQAANAEFKRLDDIALQEKLDNQEKIKAQQEELLQSTVDNAVQTGFAIAAIFSGEGPMSMALNNFSNLLVNSAANLYQVFTDTSASWQDKVGSSLQAVSDIAGAIGGILSAESEERLVEISNEENSKIAALQKQKDAGIITADQLAKGVEKIQKDAAAKELAEKKKAFEQNKAIQIVQAVIGTAQGIVAASANAFPLNVVMMALAAAVGAAQIGIIASQKFPTGGSAAGVTAPAAPAAPALPSAGNTGPNVSFAAAGANSNLNTVGAGAQLMILQNNVTISETQVTNAQTTVAGYQAGSELGDG